MLLEQLKTVLTKFKGCTFASLDAVTREGGICRHVTNERVMLFTNSKSSGYENLVHRRLVEIGKDPSTFRVGDLPWGERVPDSPLIRHRGFYYLQTILIKPGVVVYKSATGMIIPNDMARQMLRQPRGNSQGLPDDRAVVVRAYNVDNIRSIRLLGEELRRTLTIK